MILISQFYKFQVTVFFYLTCCLDFSAYVVERLGSGRDCRGWWFFCYTPAVGNFQSGSSEPVLSYYLKCFLTSCKLWYPVHVVVNPAEPFISQIPWVSSKKSTQRASLPTHLLPSLGLQRNAHTVVSQEPHLQHSPSEGPQKCQVPVESSL